MENVRIGFGCVLGAGALITRDCPPFSVLVGSPARVIKRYDMQREAWVAAQEYPEADGERALPSEAEYLAGFARQVIRRSRARGPPSGKDFGDL